MKKYLVTGAAGFIGMHTAKRLLEQGVQVVGLDNLNDYYDPALKHHRLEQLTPYNNFRFIKMDLAERDGMAQLFKTEQFTHVIHLAAQAGVRYSLENPFAYVDSNLVGTMTILEGCRHNRVQHLLYASSSSVYGMNAKIPFSETDQVDEPVSLYAATKKANELMAHSYAKLYGIPTTGLRFFTVYGRPDMAPWLFTEAILKGNPIKVFNHGKMMRDFTYIDDIVEGIVRILDIPPTPVIAAVNSVIASEAPVIASEAKQSPSDNTKPEAKQSPSEKTQVPHQLFNIGNNQPIQLARFIQAIEIFAQNKTEASDLEMLRTKKGNQYDCGMKLQVGADAFSGLVCTLVATTAAANEHAVPGLLHDEKQQVCGGWVPASASKTRAKMWSGCLPCITVPAGNIEIVEPKKVS